MLGLHQPRGAAAGWVIAFGDSSCLDDSVPHAKWPAKKQCVAPMVELLSRTLTLRLSLTLSLALTLRQP